MEASTAFTYSTILNSSYKVFLEGGNLPGYEQCSGTWPRLHWKLANGGQLRKGLGCHANKEHLRFPTGSGVICIVFDESYSGRD